LSLRP